MQHSPDVRFLCRDRGIRPVSLTILCSMQALRQDRISLHGNSPGEHTPGFLLPFHTVLFLIIVESSAGFLSEQSSADHLLKKRMRTVLGISRLGLKDVHDCQNDIKTDQISQC